MPTTMPASPLAASASAVRRAAAPCEPVSSATRVAASGAPSSPAVASGPSRAASERACCCASTSVGASSAAWPPLSTTCSIARSATTVLPEPTSPCSSRCIGASLDEVVGELRRRRRPAPASGRRAARRRRRRAARRGRPARGTPGSERVAARRWASTTCRTKASSNVSRCLARARRPRGGTACGRRAGPARGRPARGAAAGRPAAGRRRGRPCRARCGPTRATSRLDALADGRVDRHHRAGELLGDDALVVVDELVLRVRQLDLAVEALDLAGEEGLAARRAARRSAQRRLNSAIFIVAPSASRSVTSVL